MVSYFLCAQDREFEKKQKQKLNAGLSSAFYSRHFTKLKGDDMVRTM